ncbi:DUF4652 domain-containing protein [Bacillus sp. B15-48]|uniref:DUF4652 domain-containing protein n=1 Tax=Bacillus sp. B15-48 TaxID=1548601 RepID=UPI00193EF2E2|nr:DUF4652 domain-containing protein [Bacillus sp. B15-48]MBM4763530.1 DUF4652 domain-containing protein [Bacillus sp. B15-48]
MKQMKVFLLLTIFFLVLAGCTNAENPEETDTNDEVSEENNVEEPETNDEGTDEQTPSDDGAVGDEDNEQSFYEIRLNGETDEIELIDPEGKVTVLAEGPSTNPAMSNDNSKAVYISPVEWEVDSSLYLVDLETGQQEKLIGTENNLKPKNVIWHDDNHLFVIIGFSHGTVGIGGEIYYVKIESGEKIQLTEDERVEITDFHIDQNILYYEGIKYIDDIMNEYEEYSNELPLNTLDEQIEKAE